MIDWILAERIAGLLGDPAGAAAMGRAGRALVKERFSAIAVRTGSHRIVSPAM